MHILEQGSPTPVLKAHQHVMFSGFPVCRNNCITGNAKEILKHTCWWALRTGVGDLCSNEGSERVLREAAWTPLELPPLIVEHLPTWKQCIFWKVVLALPEMNDHDDPTNALSEWLKAKFSWAGVRPEVEHKQKVQTLALYSSLESQGGCPVRVNVCVKKTFLRNVNSSP
ncbi:unnamed protein product [Ranitomeya imitator]|uniref:Germinal-centre associated nuclear protein MCM3AP domain-containing protein n=1 Tax=Ranitomeya imitator TaxID=111125 RepID=A0ABN9M1Q1_9NEOB|nr:unnamed protein product [Ranitomeya imitator]